MNRQETTEARKALKAWAVEQVVGGRAKKTVAKELVEKYPHLFNDVDSARIWVRGLTGAGRKGPTPLVDLKLTQAEGLRRAFAEIRRQERRPDVNFSFSGGQQVAILSDVHVPYHAEAALIALEYCDKHGIESVLLNGDICDFAGVSRYTREINIMTLTQERTEQRKFLELVADVFPGEKVFKEGNHEVRLRNYLLTNARELADAPELDLETWLGLDELGYTTVRTNPVNIGKLLAIHGHEWGGFQFNPVNPARGLMLRAKTSAVCGHFHATSEQPFTTLSGEQHGCWSTGCLCDLSPDYKPYGFTTWNHGFAVVELDDDGSFTMNNHRIINGKVR